MSKKTAPDSKVPELYDRGLEVRRQVLGREHVERSLRTQTPFTEDLQTLITQYAWGDIWSRPGLDRRTRSLLTIALLAALGREEELKLHIRATRNTFATQDEVKEALLHTAIYAGVPAANTAFRVAREVYEEMERTPAETGP